MDMKTVWMLGEASDRHESIVTTLAACGYKVEKARDALEAIERLNAGERADLFVIGDEERAMGFREAREFLCTSGYGSIPAILVSDSVQAEEFLTSDGNWRVLGASEPLDWFELIRTTQEMIGSPRPSEVWLD